MDFGWEVKNFFLDRGIIKDSLPPAMRKALGRVGGSVRLTSQRSMRRKKNPDQASPVGSPPNAHLGQIRKFLFYAYEPNTQTVVIGPIKFAGPRFQAHRLNEFGGTITRTIPKPYSMGSKTITPAQREAYIRLVKSGRLIPAPPSKVPVTIKYPARPYMAPALQKNIDRIPAQFAGTISARIATTMSVQERIRGRRIGSTNAQREYVVRGTAGEYDESDALAEFVASPNVPGVVGSFPRRVQDWSVEEIGDGLYIGTAVWQSNDTDDGRQNQLPDTFKVSFDISGQTQRVYVSRETTGRYLVAAADAPTPDFQQAIGVQQDGTVEGCDQIIPYMTWEATYTILASDLTTDYTATLYQTVGTINAAAYQGFAAGVLLLIGVSGQKRFIPSTSNPTVGYYVYDLQFKFAVSPDETLVIGPKTIEKKGWDYLWVQFSEILETLTGGIQVLVKRPRYVYTERIYRKTDFDALGINNNGLVTPPEEEE